MDLRASLVRVLTADGRTAGTAFFCQPSGYVVTCSHVLDGNIDVNGFAQLEFCLSEQAKPKILRAVVRGEWCSSSEEDDFAVLELECPLPGEAVALELSRIKPRIGAIVETRGYPKQNPTFGMPGNAEFIGVTRDINSGKDVYVVRSDTIARGYSGAPCILRESGEVIGIVNALTTKDLEGRWPSGAFITTAEIVLAACPVLTAGIHPLVKALAKSWQDTWKLSHKYGTWLSLGLSSDKDYEFPSLEHCTDGEIQCKEPLEAIRGQLESTEPKAIVIVGAPGVGKSRLVEEIVRAMCAGSGMFSAHRKVVPLLMSARSFAGADGESLAGRLAEGARLDGILPTLKVLNAEAVDELLNDDRYRLVVLIDGADEIVKRTDRKEMFRRFVLDGKALLEAGHLMVMATRPLDELEDLAVRSMATRYDLPTLGSVESLMALAERVLGNRAADFEQIATSTGLIASLNTPLLFSLAASVFLRRSSDLPGTILGVYQQYLMLLQDTWTDAPAPNFKIVEVFSGVALGSLRQQECDDNTAAWIDEVDDAMGNAFIEILGSPKESQGAALRIAQAILNFGVRASGLVHQQAGKLQWSHLLVRDYLAALKLHSMARFDENELSRLVGARSVDPEWRETLILFIDLQSAAGQAEHYLYSIRDYRGGYGYDLILFIKDCIYRGARLNGAFLTEYFRAFEAHALRDQGLFGSARRVYMPDYGAFWHLLQLQRIPQAQIAIEHVVSQADPGTIVSEWPISGRSKTFTPRDLYAGSLAVAPEIFRHP